MRKPIHNVTRRGFLDFAVRATLGTSVGVIGYTWRIEPHWVEVVRRDLPIANLPKSLVGRRLVQISDLHVGPIVDEAYITKTIENISSLSPDILVVTGDFMTYRGNEQIDQTSRVLANMPHGRLATIGVLGNHDYGHGSPTSNDAVACRITSRLEDLGITVLRNGQTSVGGLQVAGVDDLWGPNFDPKAALSRLEPQRASIVLCHNPDGADRPGWSGYRGWILCGHTHGGQCKAPFFRPPILPVANKRYTAGEIDLHDGRRLYINRGLGYLRRVRFNARPEITVFRMQRTA